MSYLHCDKCERECPVFDEARQQGWLLSHKLSVSGIPWDIICPSCLRIRNTDIKFNSFKRPNPKEQ